MSLRIRQIAPFLARLGKNPATWRRVGEKFWGIAAMQAAVPGKYSCIAREIFFLPFLGEKRKEENVQGMNRKDGKNRICQSVK